MPTIWDRFGSLRLCRSANSINKQNIFSPRTKWCKFSSYFSHSSVPFGFYCICLALCWFQQLIRLIAHKDILQKYYTPLVSAILCHFIWTLVGAPCTACTLILCFQWLDAAFHGQNGRKSCYFWTIISVVDLFSWSQWHKNSNVIRFNCFSNS